MGLFRVSLVFVAGFKTYVAADQPTAAISCTALVSQSDCTKATASFEIERDNKIFNDVEILIANDPTKETHFDSASAYILASKINGYVIGWFMGVMATIP
jgi:hypothetical protein